MSVDTDDWEVVTKQPASANVGTPKLTIYADGTGRLNAAADRYLDRPEAVCYKLPPEGSAVAITPAGDDLPELQRYSVTRNDEGAGGDVRPRAALERLGVAVDALEETHHVDLSAVADDVLVADVTALPAATRTDERDRALDATTQAAGETDDAAEGDAPATSDDQVSSGQTFVCEPCSYEFDDADVYEGHMNDVHGEDVDDEDEIWCGVCGAGPFESTTRLSGHHNGSNHEGETVPLDHEPTADELRTADESEAPDGDADAAADHGDTEVPDPEDAPSPKVVRDCAEQVDTVQDLADLLDVTPGEARLLARDADVYGDLQDNPPRPGVSR